MWRAEGLQKSGKTLVSVGMAFAFGYGYGYNVFTNMTSCSYRGVPWATTITLDQLMKQMAVKDKEEWWIRDGFLLIDEAPTWFMKGGQAGSTVSQLLARCAVQLMKRNIKLLYTAHLGDMMPSYVDNLTECVFECTTDDGGKHIAFRAYDNQQKIMCWRNKLPWGDDDKLQWWVPGGPFFDIYDYEEAMDIFATDMSEFAGASGKKRRKALGLDGGEQQTQQYPENERDLAALDRKVNELQNLLIEGVRGAQPLDKRQRIQQEVWT